MIAIANISDKREVRVTKRHKYDISTYSDRYGNITYVFFDDDCRFSTIDENIFSVLFSDIIS